MAVKVKMNETQVQHYSGDCWKAGETGTVESAQIDNQNTYLLILLKSNKIVRAKSEQFTILKKPWYKKFLETFN